MISFRDKIEMTYMVAWKEYDEKCKREIEWHSYFERRSDALKYMDKLLEDRFKGVQLRVI